MEMYVMGTFKSGTSALTLTLNNNGIPSKKTHIEKLKENSCYFMPIRNQKEIYPSAFFQDIMQPSYTYSMAKHLNLNLNPELLRTIKYVSAEYAKIKKDDAFHKKLYETFEKTNWDEFDYLSNKSYLRVVSEMDVNFKKIPFKIGGYTIHKIQQKNITIVFIDLKMLNNIEMLNKIFVELNMPHIINDIFYANIGNAKYYKNEYEWFLKQLKLKKYFDENYYDFLTPDIFNVIE